MSKRKKMVIGIIIAAVILVMVVAGGLLYYTMGPAIRMGQDAHRLRVRLLCDTDHQALLNACRELSSRVADGELRSGVYAAQELSRFPKPIPDLEPDHVTIDEDVVKVEMMYSGWTPLGVYAYRQGYPTRSPPFKYGDRELLEGLWYYDDGYRAHPDAYDKKIDALLRNCGRIR